MSLAHIMEEIVLPIVGVVTAAIVTYLHKKKGKK